MCVAALELQPWVDFASARVHIDAPMHDEVRRLAPCSFLYVLLVTVLSIHTVDSGDPSFRMCCCCQSACGAAATNASVGFPKTMSSGYQVSKVASF
jgi:hypothetical protein